MPDFLNKNVLEVTWLFYCAYWICKRRLHRALRKQESIVCIHSQLDLKCFSISWIALIFSRITSILKRKFFVVVAFFFLVRNRKCYNNSIYWSMLNTHLPRWIVYMIEKDHLLGFEHVSNERNKTCTFFYLFEIVFVCVCHRRQYSRGFTSLGIWN